MILHVLERLEVHAQCRGDQPAFAQVTPLCAGSISLTYQQLHTAAIATARKLRRVMQPGDVVLLCAYNRPEFVVGYLGALAANLTVFPLYPSISDTEMREAAVRSNAKAFLGLADRFAAVDDLELELLNVLEISPSDHVAPEVVECDQAAMLLQSSGTTGSPKIVRRVGESLDAVAANVAQTLGLSRDDHVLAAIPLCHSYGVEHGLLGPVLAGCTVHLCDTFDTRLIVPQLEERNITVYPGTPFMFEMLAAAMDVHSAPSLRLAFSAGAPLPESVVDAFHAKTGLHIGQLYGSTEVGSVTFSHPCDSSKNPRCVGKAMNGVDIRIVDVDAPNIASPLPRGRDGHVAIAAPSMLKNYVDDPMPVLNEGYFMTGDLGRLDSAGNLTITGRVKLQIDIGGLKVNPLEIERVLMSHPGVGECVVVPAAVTATLDRLCAIITARDPSSPPNLDDLRAFARQRLSRHKIPRIFEIRSSLPRTSSGKVIRGALQCA